MSPAPSLSVFSVSSCLSSLVCFSLSPMVSTPWPHPSLPAHHSVSPSHCVSSPLSPSPAVYMSLFLGLCLPPSLSPFFSLPTPHSMLIPFVFLQPLQEVFSSFLSDLVLTVSASLSLFLSDSPKSRAGALVSCLVPLWKGPPRDQQWGCENTQAS